MKVPLVSVVMPTLNSGRFIRETIHSLIDQTYPRFELIVVDGGSTDDTIGIVERYMDDGDVNLIQLPPEKGSMPQSLNAGLAAAKGEFIARMDADDLAYERRLQDQVNFLVRLPEVSLVGSGADIFWDFDSVARSPLWHYDITHMFLINNPFFHPTIMFRRELYDEGLYYYDEEQVCEEDYELWGRLIPKAITANLDQSSIRYRIHGQNAQYDPRKFWSKQRALTNFCEGFGIPDDGLVDALAEFQCGEFMRYNSYLILRDYANRAELKKLPKLGWIHDGLLREKTYAAFQAWYRKMKGWPA